MADLVVDTHVLQQIIYKYDSNIKIQNFVPDEFISRDVCKILNEIILKEGIEGYVVASTLAFVELANRFSDIATNKFDYYKLKAFVVQPPIWFIIEDLSFECVRHLNDIPTHVTVGTEYKPIEINDAIHLATALIRGIDTSYLASKDTSLRAIDKYKTRII